MQRHEEHACEKKKARLTEEARLRELSGEQEPDTEDPSPNAVPNEDKLRQNALSALEELSEEE